MGMEYTNSNQVHLHPVAVRLLTEVKVHRRKIKHMVHKTIHSSPASQHKCFCKITAVFPDTAEARLCTACRSSSQYSLALFQSTNPRSSLLSRQISYYYYRKISNFGKRPPLHAPGIETIFDSPLVKNSVLPGYHAPTEHRRGQVYGGGHLNVPASRLHAERIQDIMIFWLVKISYSPYLSLMWALKMYPSLPSVIATVPDIANRCQGREYCFSP